VGHSGPDTARVSLSHPEHPTVSYRRPSLARGLWKRTHAGQLAVERVTDAVESSYRLYGNCRLCRQRAAFCPDLQYRFYVQPSVAQPGETILERAE